MSKQTDPNDKPTLWSRIWQRPASRWLLGIPLGAYIMFTLGAAAVVGSEVAIYASGTEKFCTSACHSMAAFTAPEWRDSPHNNSASGVRATCSDCHIPHIYPLKLWVKTKAGIKDAYHELKGTISTREKYEAHRARMAEEVWSYMIATDSRECRHCHSEDHFNLAKQSDKALRAHLETEGGGKKTCIECHQGIAHRTPDEFLEENQTERE
ncbi:MAG: NapC/NirT family cytochrome c [Gammaproteobacteria bacterium]